VTRALQRINWRGFVVPLALLLVAELAVAITGYRGAALARPSDIAAAAVEALRDGSMLAATAQTLLSAFAGVAIGGAIGLALGLALGLAPTLYLLLEVPLETIRPIPSVALIPLVLMIFGLGYAMEISLVAKTALWPVFFLSYAAVRGVKPRLLEVSRLLGMGFLARARKIVLPAALPGIFVGFRISIAAALIVAVTVEIAANPIGLGHAMMQAEERLRPDLVFAYLFWVGLVGWLVNAAVEWLQRCIVGSGPAAAPVRA
jgi:ABC-type nitrate/sulfonate/bicarbonate transport system permease component